MVAALLHPSAIRPGAPTLFVMSAIGDEIKAWEDGARSEAEAILRIRVLIDADRALHAIVPGLIPPQKPLLRRRAPP